MVNDTANKTGIDGKRYDDVQEIKADSGMRANPDFTFAEIGYSIPNYILKKLSLLDCAINFRILSFGMAIDDYC